MKKDDFVASVAGMTGLTKKATSETMAAAFQVIADELQSGEQIAWPGFGVFKVIDKAAREGRNPNTGAVIQIPAGKAVKFSPAASLKETIKG